MWFCTNRGFISAVEDFNDKSRLLVRARRREHLEKIFPSRQIIELDDADYKYRISISKIEFADHIHDMILNIDYPNFKSSVDDEDLHNMYIRFWSIGYETQI